MPDFVSQLSPVVLVPHGILICQLIWAHLLLLLLSQRIMKVDNLDKTQFIYEKVYFDIVCKFPFNILVQIFLIGLLLIRVVLCFFQLSYLTRILDLIKIILFLLLIRTTILEEINLLHTLDSDIDL